MWIMLMAYDTIETQGTRGLVATFGVPRPPDRLAARPFTYKVWKLLLQRSIIDKVPVTAQCLFDGWLQC